MKRSLLEVVKNVITKKNDEEFLWKTRDEFHEKEVLDIINGMDNVQLLELIDVFLRNY